MYVDNLNVIHTATEFVLSFLQTQPPMIKSDADWETIKTVKSKCVARLVVSPVRIHELIQVLMINWQRYVQKYIQHDGADATANDTEAGSDKK